MLRIINNRILSNEHKTLCELHVSKNGTNLYSFVGLELPWKDNKPKISCIPPGTYDGVAINRFSNRDYALWIQNVPGRTQILFHVGNYVHQINGCLLPGVSFKDIDKDGVMDVASSRTALIELEKLIPVGDKFKYHIFESWRVYGNIDKTQL